MVRFHVRVLQVKFLLLYIERLGRIILRLDCLSNFAVFEPDRVRIERFP
jgi:hypothetical protein